MGRLFKIFRDKRGAAAVEMALFAPVLCASLLAMADLGMTVYGRADMQGAVRAGIQYIMNGGHDTDTAEQVVLQSWPNRPGDAAVDANRYCVCGETETACNTQCSDLTAPRAFTRITASATLGRFVFSQHVSADEVTRVR